MWWLFLLIGLLAGAGLGCIFSALMTMSSLEDRLSEMRDRYQDEVWKLMDEVERLKNGKE